LIQGKPSGHIVDNWKIRNRPGDYFNIFRKKNTGFACGINTDWGR
jgi:hypothetical protein